MKRRTFCVVLILAAVSLIAVACAAAAEVTEEPIAEPTGAPAPTKSMEQPDATEPATREPTPMPGGASPTPEPEPEIEERLVEVEWPASMRVGDNDLIRFSLKPAPDGGYIPTPEVGGHEVEATPIPMTVTRPGYTGYVRAALSAAGLNAELAGPEEQSLVPGQANTWRWTVSPDQGGTYHAVINLSVRWEPEPGTDLPGPLTEVVWERMLTVEARSTLGLSGIQTDLVAAGGSVLGAVSGIPFAEKGLGLLWQQIKRWRKVKGTSPKKTQ
jgi:hypothetical protein